MAAYTKLAGGIVYDPTNGINGKKRDIYIHDGRICKKPPSNARISKTWDLAGNIIMAGAIDIHTHIGGGKANIARMMLPEDHASDPIAAGKFTRSGCGHAIPSTFATGYRYAEMGYTACFEPAMLASNARHTHMELADTPMVDKGAYVVLGNDDYLLRMLAKKKDPALIRDYVAWMVHATQALGVKVVNPGGISAFKFNQRQLDLDEKHVHYGITPRQTLNALIDAVEDLGLPHPLHVHGCNLGVPGNVQTTLDTLAATNGRRMHMTHIQFHSYGTEGEHKFSSGAAAVAEFINKHKCLSVDVGQILFNQTVTISGDSMHQYAGIPHAHPRKSAILDIECDAGCGVVPFRYRNRNYVNALQWVTGLELFLLIEDPWRLFMTTDHPNGAPFTSYPHLIRLLMDKDFRRDMLATIHPDAAGTSPLPCIEREYSLYEIAILTRAAPARSLGLGNYGHLGPGAVADITVYKPHADRERMFSTPEHVFKNGSPIVRKGKIIASAQGQVHSLRPEWDKAVEKQLRRYFNDYMSVKMDNFRIQDQEILEWNSSGLVLHECTSQS
ncbi:MAG: formylmethanofuran dehydrogenase subunit A [Candidatus Eutrophobiaceae bacterium]